MKVFITKCKKKKKNYNHCPLSKSVLCQGRRTQSANFQMDVNLATVRESYSSLCRQVRIPPKAGSGNHWYVSLRKTRRSSKYQPSDDPRPIRFCFPPSSAFLKLPSSFCLWACLIHNRDGWKNRSSIFFFFFGRTTGLAKS